MPLRASVKVRSRHPEAPATITPRHDGSLEVEFDQPQLAVSPGQAAVFYQALICNGYTATLQAVPARHQTIPRKLGY